MIVTLLKQSKTLETLSLSSCHGILVSKIAEGLQASTSIQHFFMNECGLMDDDIKQLCTAVQNHHSLKTLSLDSNNIMSAGFSSICAMLKTTPSITNMGYLRSLPEVTIVESN